MLALNRSQFSGWIIAKELGAIPNNQTSAPQNAQAPEEVHAAKPSAPWQREPIIDLPACYSLTPSHCGSSLGCSGTNSDWR